jgi:hypothetical protein
MEDSNFKVKRAGFQRIKYTFAEKNLDYSAVGK